jgi:hypothetical protein
MFLPPNRDLPHGLTFLSTFTHQSYCEYLSTLPISILKKLRVHLKMIVRMTYICLAIALCTVAAQVKLGETLVSGRYIQELQQEFYGGE